MMREREQHNVLRARRLRRVRNVRCLRSIFCITSFPNGVLLRGKMPPIDACLVCIVPSDAERHQ